MGENAKKIGDKLEGFGERLFERFGWTELTRDQQISCKKSKHKNDKGQRKTTHGIDIYHSYIDPYKRMKLGVITECKNYQWESINKSNLQKWFDQLHDTIECTQSSKEIEEYNNKCDVINTGILLVHANDNKYDESKFREYLSDLKYPQKRNPINIFIASNKEIEKWDSMFSYIENYNNDSANEFRFYNPSISGSGIKKYEYITLTQLYSDYIFAQNKIMIEERRGNKVINSSSCNQLIIFSFDKISKDSFAYICDMFKELQLENFDEYIFCFYPETKQDAELINNEFIIYAKKELGKETGDKMNFHILDNRRLSPVDVK